MTRAPPSPRGCKHLAELVAPCPAGAAASVLPLATPLQGHFAHPTLPLPAEGCGMCPAPNLRPGSSGCGGSVPVQLRDGSGWLLVFLLPVRSSNSGSRHLLPGTAGGRGEHTSGRQPWVRHPAPDLHRQRGNQPKTSPKRWVHVKFTRGALLRIHDCFSACREPFEASRARMGALGSTSLLPHKEASASWGHPPPCSWSSRKTLAAEVPSDSPLDSQRDTGRRQGEQKH